MVKSEDYELQNTVQEHVIARMMLTIIIQWGRREICNCGKHEWGFASHRKKPAGFRMFCLYIKNKYIYIYVTIVALAT